MPEKYDIHDEYGGKIGELRPSMGLEDLGCYGPFLTILVFLAIISSAISSIVSYLPYCIGAGIVLFVLSVVTRRTFGTDVASPEVVNRRARILLSFLLIPFIAFGVFVIVLMPTGKLIPDWDLPSLLFQRVSFNTVQTLIDPYVSLPLPQPALVTLLTVLGLVLLFLIAPTRLRIFLVVASIVLGIPLLFVMKTQVELLQREMDNLGWGDGRGFPPFTHGTQALVEINAVQSPLCVRRKPVMLNWYPKPRGSTYYYGSTRITRFIPIARNEQNTWLAVDQEGLRSILSDEDYSHIFEYLEEKDAAAVQAGTLIMWVKIDERDFKCNFETESLPILLP